MGDDKERIGFFSIFGLLWSLLASIFRHAKKAGLHKGKGWGNFDPNSAQNLSKKIAEEVPVSAPPPDRNLSFESSNEKGNEIVITQPRINERQVLVVKRRSRVK